MRKFCTYGSVRGHQVIDVPYRDPKKSSYCDFGPGNCYGFANSGLSSLIIAMNRMIKGIVIIAADPE